ncbi:hypothetical protein L4C31_00830 [Aliivibrio sifiae]|uniref:hypothetical protein n=1 Tax=Aliivibrio fischeri TaxID=668 RepID=UPI00084C7138|nr:hypothetical protein [Aliivibrio fischeri]OED53035.1 hypothetical protein BEI47_18290 [Aliivibrio fischeri]
MNKVVSFSLVILGVIAYFSYESYVAKPKELESSSKVMLGQMGIKEKWFDAFKVMDGSIVLSRYIESSFIDGDTVHSIGKIEYAIKKQHFCKYVDFNFKLNSLNDYHINSVSSCLN